MTCSICNSRGHNKRGYPKSVESTTGKEPSNSDRRKRKTSNSGKGRGRPKKQPTVVEPSAKRPRGRPRKDPTASTRSAPPSASIFAAPNAPGAPAAPSADYPASSSVPLDYHSPAIPTNSKRERGRPKESTISYKRSSVIGMGMFQNENGFKALNPVVSSYKIFSTGTTRVTRSSDVTGDIGFKPSTTNKLKWNGKAVISIRKLQEMKEKVVQRIFRVQCRYSTGFKLEDCFVDTSTFSHFVVMIY